MFNLSFKPRHDIPVIDSNNSDKDCLTFVESVCEASLDKYLETFDLNESSIEVDCQLTGFDVEEWVKVFESHIFNINDWVFEFNASKVTVDTWTSSTKDYLKISPKIEPIPLFEFDINSTAA